MAAQFQSPKPLGSGKARVLSKMLNIIITFHNWRRRGEMEGKRQRGTEEETERRDGGEETEMKSQRGES
jgi:hypothetical protein